MSAFHPFQLGRRARVARAVVWIAGAALLVGFFRVQILSHGRFRLQSETNRLRPVPLLAPRGLILDRRGQVLADNVPGYTVALLPGPLDSLRHTLERLAPIVGLDAAAIDRILARYAREPYQPARVLTDAPFGVVSALEERRLLFPGLVIQTEPKRTYPDSSIVAHLVGFVGEAAEQEIQYTRAGQLRLRGLVGKDGLEREYDGDLRGADGVRFVEVSALGRLVREEGAAPPLPPVPGRNIATTLDLDLQRYVARTFPAGRRGAVVVMRPNTGEILALYSSPSFNPNAFVGGVDPAYWAELNQSESHPLINRAIQARYAPASTWKLVVAAMAMKRGLVTLRTRMPEPCRGGLQYGNRYFRCWQLQGHGSLDLEGAIAHSCDVYFYQLGLKLGVTSFLEDATAWGFRERTGIDLPGEISPDFPGGTEYFDRRYGPRGWTRAVMLNLAIGQGENAQTLIRMVEFYAMLAREGEGAGRAPTPHLVRAGQAAKPSLDLPPNDMAGIRQSLIAVVEEGTARGGRLRSITIAGKTGTAQNPFGPDHGWFVGFAPADHPEVVVGVILEFAEHGTAAVPYVSHIIAHHLLGADSASVGAFRFTVPADTAPEPLPLLPGPVRRAPLPPTLLPVPRDTVAIPDARPSTRPR